MKPGLDGVLGLSDDRPDLREAKPAIKPERDHGSIPRFEPQQRSPDANEFEVVECVESGIDRLLALDVTAPCRTLAAPVTDSKVGYHANQPGLLIGAGRQAAMMFPEAKKGVMGDFSGDVPIEDDEIRAAYDRSIGRGIYAVKPVLSLPGRCYNPHSKTQRSGGVMGFSSTASSSSWRSLRRRPDR